MSSKNVNTSSKKTVDNSKTKKIPRKGVKETRNTTYTPRQKEAFEKIHLEKKTTAQAMREAGYSPAVVKNPKELTSSKGYQTLLDEYREALVNAGVTKHYRANKARKLLESKQEHIALNTLKHVDSILTESDDKAGNVFNAPVQIVVKQYDGKSKLKR